MANYPQYTDRVQYELYNDLTGAIIIQEPEGWQNDEKEYARNEDYFGVFGKFSNSLKFYKESKDIIQLIYDVQGINAEVRLVKFEKHPKTDEWKVIYSGYLDFSTWESNDDGSVSLKFNNGGLEKLLKNREKTTVEIDRIDTLDGKDLPPLKNIQVMLDGREIFLHSKWKISETTKAVSAGVKSDTTGNRYQTSGIPIFLEVNSHGDYAHSILQGSLGNDERGSSGMMMLGPFDRQRKITLEIENFKFKPVVYEGSYNWAVMYICLSTYKMENSEFKLVKREPLWRARGGDTQPGDTPLSLVINKENTISGIIKSYEVEVGTCISLELFIAANFRANGHRNTFYVALEDLKIENIEVKEESQFPQTKTKAILAHELFDRLSQIATSQNKVFYSEFFGRQNIGYSKNGIGSETAVTHGFWIRGFDKEPIPNEGPPKVENLFKPLTTSFKDAFDSMSAIWGVGLGIESIGRSERIRIEDKKYFFNNNVTIKLPNQVKKVKRSVATSYYYSKLQHGFQKGGAYEEAYGLDEYNTILEHQTPITRLEKTFVNTSSYRADSYGMEFCRRKQREQNDTIDTNYDDNIWVMDLKRYNDQIYLQRKWQDDFEAAPTGIYSPNTATNLRFSPANSMQRHSWFFSNCFWKDGEKFVKYTSSTANSGMTTKMKGKGAVKENQDFLSIDFNKSRFVPEWIEFEHICDFEIMELIEGTTTINGSEVPNVYGLIEFINEDNELEKGYLFSLKPNKEGKWKLLKSSR
ncbi:hypothetical protein K5I29_02415 [Flavobacterium agricola]|uniref:Uncharacterized protein n=1 Tax=Flavobacterium agricola TaxID=2870839 RepID=A0ABY6M370_9FLAO|nr:hypothetical protein [Flavobacterium agricola]UYW01798.1 hypothetical protein K5I29_02415 [Flavobacterium agricola]